MIAPNKWLQRAQQDVIKLACASLPPPCRAAEPRRQADMAGKVQPDPDEVDRAFSEAINQADMLHRDLVTAAGEVGYIRDTLIRARPYYVAMASQKGTASSSTFVASGQQFVQSYGDELRLLRLDVSGVAHRVTSAAGTAVAFSSMTEPCEDLVCGCADTLLRYSTEKQPNKAYLDSSPQGPKSD